jgi:hypothetical protein
MLAEQVKVGGCYRTVKKTVNKVLEITDEGRVKFVTRSESYARGEKSWTPGAPANALPRLSVFALKLVCEVQEDWDPKIHPTPKPAYVSISVPIIRESQGDTAAMVAAAAAAANAVGKKSKNDMGPPDF